MSSRTVTQVRHDILYDPADIAVLVVDDDPDINQLLQTRLKVRGFQVRGAFNGREALDCIRQSQPDLLMLDVSMPEMGGMDVLKWVRGEGRDICIIMTTAFGSEQVAIEALRNGADDYLRKPFEPVELRATVDRTISRQVLQRQNTELRNRLENQRKQLEAEVARAARVQSSLLPEVSPELHGFTIAARCLPAREVGGDFFDWQVLPDGQCVFTLGDVMGKGMPAAILMATARAALRSATVVASPRDAVESIERALGDDLDRNGAFITLFHAVLNPALRRVSYVDAGHGHGFVRRASGDVETLDARRTPIGLAFGQPTPEAGLDFQPGDALVLFSDGLLEANPDRAPDVHDVAGWLSGCNTAAEMVERMLDLASPGPELQDDLTVLVLACNSV